MQKEEYDKGLVLLNKWSEAYNNSEKLLATDEEYDILYHKLLEFEKEHGITSKLKTVANGTAKGRVKHEPRMWSMSNVFNKEELQKWIKNLKVECHEFLLQDKYDGLAMSIVVENGRVSDLVTRGDGFYGESVLHNKNNIMNIPMSFTNESFKVRGEVCITKPMFELINKHAAKNDTRIYTNPRNAAAGLLSSESLPDYVKFIFKPWGLFTTSDYADFETLEEMYERIEELGFKVDRLHYCGTVDEIERIYKETIVNRRSLDVGIDGTVININSISLQKECGFNSKDPKWRTAYKFPAIERTTTILDIIPQVGRYGHITPVGRVVPVEIDGVVVSNVTLHNYDYVKRSDIRINDKVIIIRSGDVIPKLMRVFTDRRTGDEIVASPPKVCPACREHTNIHPDELKDTKRINLMDVRCLNPCCVAKTKGVLEHHVSRNAMDISGLGPSFIENVIKVHEVDSIKSLYGLSYRDLMRLDNMQDKSVKKILASIESVKGSRTLARFIYSLSIHHVGKRASKTIAEGLGKNYLEPTEESLIKLGLSSNVIKSYLEYMKVHKNEVDELEKILRPVMTIEDTNNKLKVCITGKLSIPKTEFAKLFPNINFVNNLDKTTDVLIYETKNSTKYNRASRYNITRLTEKEFKENYNE